jgi:hypothetical protein
MAIAAYNDLDEHLLSDGASAAFYGYEHTNQCQADRARRDACQSVDARLGMSNQNWVFMLWGRNPTDDDSVQGMNLAPEFGGSFIRPSSLRANGVDATDRH